MSNSEQQTPSRNTIASLGVGTLIVIAFIVLVFGRVNLKPLTNEVASMRTSVESLEQEVISLRKQNEGLQEAVTDLAERSSP
jgi:uncharacterized protein YoxC